MRNLSCRVLVEERFMAQKPREGEEVLASLGMAVVASRIRIPRILCGCILRREATFRLAGLQMSRADRTAGGRCLYSWRGLVLWVCAFSLLFALASRVPRFKGSEVSWVRATPPQMTAKILAKDFYLLQAPASGILTRPRLILIRKLVKETRPPFAVFLDNRLYTRPPPTA